jgi:hypothetical protein
MYHPILIERLADERIAELRCSVRPACPLERRATAPRIREALAHLLVKAGMLVHHGAGERAATHVHHAG